LSVSPAWLRAAVVVMLAVNAVLIWVALSRHHHHTPTDHALGDPSRRTSAVHRRESNNAMRPTIELRRRAYHARPFATVRLDGRVRNARPASVAVQLLSRGSWISFPIHAVVDGAGRFVAYVDLGGRGTYRLRIIDLRGRAASPLLRVSVT
jgi:hypothetical protein